MTFGLDPSRARSAPHGDNGRLLSLDLHERPEALVLAVRGEIDINTQSLLRDALAAAFSRARSGPLVLDLTEVTFMGEAGLAVLIEAVVTDFTEPERPSLRLAVDHQRGVIRPIHLVGLDSFVALYTTVEEAIAAEHGRTE